MGRADKLTTFKGRLSWNLGPSNSRNSQGLSRHVQTLLYLTYGRIYKCTCTPKVFKQIYIRTFRWIVFFGSVAETNNLWWHTNLIMIFVLHKWELKDSYWRIREARGYRAYWTKSVVTVIGSVREHINRNVLHVTVTKRSFFYIKVRHKCIKGTFFFVALSVRCNI